MYDCNFFYYTSSDTTVKILENGEIWATNVRFMNDSEEFINGLNEIATLNKNKMIIQCAKELTELDYIKYYIISFSGQEDSLSQWFMYAKESGISLEMDFKEYGSDACYSLVENNSDDESIENISGKIDLQKIIYCTSDSSSMEAIERKNATDRIKKFIKSKCIDNRSRSITLNGVAESALLIKRYEFFQEKESRAIINVSNLLSDKNKPIFYRIDNSVVKSYVKVRCCMADKFTGWPIIAVMVGPGFNQDIVYDSMKLFLDTAQLCIPDVAHISYIDRIKNYFLKAAERFNNKDKEKFINYVLDHKWNFVNDFSGNIFNYQMHQHVLQFPKFVRNELKLEKQSTAELYRYMSENYFSNSGIVLKKSTIPYIF